MRIAVIFLCLAFSLTRQALSPAIDLVLHLDGGDDLAFVGAIQRWRSNGNLTRAVDPKARIDSPQVTAIGKLAADGTWVFSGLAAGRYDLVLLTRDKTRIEGFGYPPVLEFDPFYNAQDEPPAAAVQWITNDIKQSRYYENKVTPLHFAGNDKQVRVFMQLLRDKPTSFDSTLGQPAATLRHEVWQYTHKYGAWSKEKRTRVVDRLLMPKSELRTWTWVWDPRLGMIELREKAVTLNYSLPKATADKSLPGLYPY